MYYLKKISILSVFIIVIILIIINCSNRPDFIIHINDDGFVLIFVPLCPEIEAKIQFPDPSFKLIYNAQIKCKSGDNYTIKVSTTKWTGMFKEAEYEVDVNGKHFKVKASDPQSEITGKKVAFLISGDTIPLPYTSVPCKGKFESNVKFSYNNEGKRQVSRHDLKCDGKKYIIKYYNYKYNDYGGLKNFSAHLSYKDEFKKLEDKKIIADIAKNNKVKDVREAAVDKIEDQKELAEIEKISEIEDLLPKKKMPRKIFSNIKEEDSLFINNSQIIKLPKTKVPQLIKHVKPKYPQVALRAKIQCNVIIDVTVDIFGIVTKTEIISGHPLFNESAVNAVKQWRYIPYIFNGIPRSFQSSITLEFKFPEVIVK